MNPGTGSRVTKRREWCRESERRFRNPWRRVEPLARSLKAATSLTCSVKLEEQRGLKGALNSASGSVLLEVYVGSVLRWYQQARAELVVHATAVPGGGVVCGRDCGVATTR
ncbi:hypothetical protein AXG93_4368s2280 [Marchantia polymorpha subsp. ruderalis]|uniref:Uncharacterized protein n=1 Tax=Marchantia polymorpha subsp. ruderalis TaxID=1480154 RepID=A0A176VY87_MARPO|nr:hypothetical protein AXG93_4368s2280 [Marchantia polymorpha subsp. ruderalis]